MNLNLDIRTVYFIGALTSLICAAMLFASRHLHRRSQSGVAWGGAGLLMIGLAMMGFSLRGAVPNLLSYQVANTLGSLGVVMLYESTRRLCFARPMPWLAGAVGAGLFAVHLWLGDSPEAHAERLLATSLVQGACAVMTLPLLIGRIGKDPAIPIHSAIAFTCVALLIHVVRTIVVLSTGVATSSGGMFVAGPLQGAVAALFSMLPMIHAMVVLGWINGRIAVELRQMATVDELTGLATRRHFFALTRERLDPVRTGREAFGLLMLDLDGFKQINDRHGHGTGDRVLAHFAAVLGDALADGDEAGRYGGEEFCALLRRDSEDALRASAEAIRQAVRSSPLIEGDETIHISVSIGVASTHESTALEDLLVIADRRVYLAKAMGRDRVVDRRTGTSHGGRTASDAAGDGTATCGRGQAARADSAPPNRLPASSWA